MGIQQVYGKRSIIEKNTRKGERRTSVTCGATWVNEVIFCSYPISKSCFTHQIYTSDAGSGREGSG